MNKITFSIIGIVVVGGIAAAMTLGSNTQTEAITSGSPVAQPDTTQQVTNTPAVPTPPTAPTPTTPQALPATPPVLDPEPVQQEPSEPQGTGTYTDYSETALAEAHARGDRVFLFFYAAWCPFCRVADSDFKANSNKLPGNVTVLKTDFDTENRLKSEYGVTYQHTFVEVSPDGAEIQQWTDSGAGVDNLLEHI